MNGAVHGDAMTTASTPEPNASSVRFFAVQFGDAPTATSWPNSNTPDRLSASTKNSTASAVTTARRLQLEAPAELLAGGAQRDEQRGPARRTSTMTPPANAIASWRSVGRVSCCVAKPSTLSDSTGNTHGIRLRIRPPRSANTIASASVSGSPPARRRREIERGRAARARASGRRRRVPASGDVDRRRARVRRRSRWPR